MGFIKTLYHICQSHSTNKKGLELSFAQRIQLHGSYTRVLFTKLFSVTTGSVLLEAPPMPRVRLQVPLLLALQEMSDSAKHLLWKPLQSLASSSTTHSLITLSLLTSHEGFFITQAFRTLILPPPHECLTPRHIHLS